MSKLEVWLEKIHKMQCKNTKKKKLQTMSRDGYRRRSNLSASRDL
jgi:hypothetical protein